MIDTTKKKVHNVAARVPDNVYRAVKRTFADTDETFQSLVVKLFAEYVIAHGGTLEKIEELQPVPKRRAGGR